MMVEEGCVTNTILIVGEDANALIIAATLLRARGLSVRTVADAMEGCDILACEGALVVVLDLTFPETRGLELLRRLRGRFETRLLPSQPAVVVMTDWFESAVERLAVGLGADAFLRKPVAPGDFLAAVERFLPATESPASALAVNA